MVLATNLPFSKSTIIFNFMGIRAGLSAFSLDSTDEDTGFVVKIKQIKHKTEKESD
jgi:hypothetical protein